MLVRIKILADERISARAPAALCKTLCELLTGATVWLSLIYLFSSYAMVCCAVSFSFRVKKKEKNKFTAVMEEIMQLYKHGCGTMRVLVPMVHCVLKVICLFFICSN